MHCSQRCHGSNYPQHEEASKAGTTGEPEKGRKATADGRKSFHSSQEAQGNGSSLGEKRQTSPRTEKKETPS